MKIGTKVKVVKQGLGHCFQIGQVVTLVDVKLGACDFEGDYYARPGTFIRQYMLPDQYEAIEEEK